MCHALGVRKIKLSVVPAPSSPASSNKSCLHRWLFEPLQIESSCLNALLAFVEAENGAIRQHRQIGVGAGAWFQGFADGPSLAVITAEFDGEVLAPGTPRMDFRAGLVKREAQTS